MSKTRILSIDCANKSIGVCIIDFVNFIQNDRMIHKIKNYLRKSFTSFNTINEKALVLKETITKLNKLFDDMFYIYYINVFDLLPGEKVKDTISYKRACRLNGLLRYIDDICDDVIPEHVLLEYQMGPNDKSREICSKIEMWYSTPDYEFAQKSSYFKNKFPIRVELELKKNIPKPKIHIIGPTLKNTITLASHLKHCLFLAKYMDPYNANKAHCRESLIYFLQQNNMMYLVSGIKKSNMDDAGDAFMMAVAWIGKTFFGNR